VYEGKVINHSVSPAGVELVTYEVNWPHAVHKDGMTHRWARNFQSFRALPPEILLDKMEAGEFFIPEVFGHRVKGMGQRNEPVNGQDSIDQDLAREVWMQHVEDTIAKARKFLTLGIAKQQVNFLIQDLCFIRGIITTTIPQLENFFNLRLDVDENGDPVARPEVYKVAKLMKDSYEASEPKTIRHGSWHLPLIDLADYGEVADVAAIDGEDEANHILRRISVGRCARVSYLTHHGVRDPEKDWALADKLRADGHMSPFEHQGRPIEEPWYDKAKTGSFGYGWRQFRKFIPGEAVYKGSYNEPEGTYVIN
jgi:hypothetical protein